MSQLRAYSLALAVAGAGAAACSGDDGMQGPAGAAGAQGPTGMMGTRGAEGPTGATGGMGAPGATGATGAVGATGAMGEQGETVILSARAKLGLDISPVPVDTATSPAQIEKIGRGSYLVNATADCNGCHQNARPNGPPRYLGGGSPFALGPGAVVYARNLTPHPTAGLTLTEAQFITAIRTGRDHRTANESLMVMPWPSYRWMSDDDLRAIYAYLRAIPPVDNVVPADIKPPSPPTPFTGRFTDGEVDRDLPPSEAPDPNNVLRGLAIHPLANPTEAQLANLPVETQALFGRGAYLVNAVSNCVGCHTNPEREFMRPNPSGDPMQINTAQFLTGGAVFDVPPGLDEMSRQKRTMSSNLVGQRNGVMNQMNLFQFVATLTQGVHQDLQHQDQAGGPKPPLGFPMPWEMLRFMDLDDMTAIYVYLTNLPQPVGINDKLTQRVARFCRQPTDCASGESCNTATNECYNTACNAPDQCGACQLCNGVMCTLTPTTSACYTRGI